MTRSAVLLMGFLALMISTAQAINNLTSKYDNGRSGLNLSETTLTLQNVNSNSFGKLFERTASGDMYPQPLIVDGLSIGGGTHNVVFVATANNNVYAYDADDALRTSPYWSVNLGTAVPATDVDCCCTDVASTVGVMGTPAIDAVSKTMYLIAKNKNADGTYSGFDATGLEKGSVGEFHVFEGASSGLLGDADIATAAEAIEPGTSAVMIMFENRWAVPFISEVHRNGGVFIDAQRIPHQDLIDAVEAGEEH